MQNIFELELKQGKAKDNNKLDTDHSKPVILVCFDGGGVRGLVTLPLLQEIEKRLKHPVHNYRYFQWLADASTL